MIYAIGGILIVAAVLLGCGALADRLPEKCMQCLLRPLGIDGGDAQTEGKRQVSAKRSAAQAICAGTKYGAPSFCQSRSRAS